MLATYRCSPHSQLEWRTPAEVIHGRQPKNVLSLFLPCDDDCRSNDVANEKVSCSRLPKYSIGGLVFAQNYASGAKWFPGTVTKIFGNVTYMIRTERGLWISHQNQLLRRLCDFKTCDDSSAPGQDHDEFEINDTEPSSRSHSQNDELSTFHETPLATSASRRYPTQVRKQPNFTYDIMARSKQV